MYALVCVVRCCYVMLVVGVCCLSVDMCLYALLVIVMWCVFVVC